jgi:hypothetical protein
VVRGALKQVQFAQGMVCLLSSPVNATILFFRLIEIIRLPVHAEPVEATFFAGDRLAATQEHLGRGNRSARKRKKTESRFSGMIITAEFESPLRNKAKKHN